VLAIGDQLNDLEMLTAVGHGAAMPSSPEAVIEAARYVAPPLDEEGAAQLIEQLALAGHREAAAAARALEARATGIREELERRRRAATAASPAGAPTASARPVPR
jgi:hypothetical protein